MSELFCHTVTQQCPATCCHHPLTQAGFIKPSTFLVEKVARWKKVAAQLYHDMVATTPN